MSASAAARFASPEEAIAYMKRVAVARSGFSAWLDVEPVTVWEGESELTLALRPEMTQHHGYAHGAIVGLMADNACAWAGASVAGDVVTGGYTIDFLRPAKGSGCGPRGRWSRRASARWWCAPMSGRRATARRRSMSRSRRRPSCRRASRADPHRLGGPSGPC